MRRTRVGDLMTAAAVSATPTTTYQQLVSLLTTHRISGVPVIDERRRVLGVVSGADLLARARDGRVRRRPWAGAAVKHGLTAAELMTSPAVTAFAGTPLTVAAQRMRDAHVRRLPVVDDRGVLVGIVSRTDLLRVFLRDDHQIATEVTDFLLRVFLLGPLSVDAQVRDGVVTLRGQLSGAELIDLVAAAVGEVDGVVEVRNLLRTAMAADAVR